MSYNYTKAYKNNGDTKARGVQELYQTNQAKICLPPSRPSLTSYALETRGALRMIRVSIFSKWLIPQGGRLWSAYIAQGVQREPLDQTDLKDDVDATLGGDGGIFRKMPVREAYRGPGGMHVGPASPTWRWLASPSMESLLESSRTFQHRCHRIIPWFLLTNRSPLTVFWINPAEFRDSPNS
jgi:hypothetical protein